MFNDILIKKAYNIPRNYNIIFLLTGSLVGLFFVTNCNKNTNSVVSTTKETVPEENITKPVNSNNEFKVFDGTYFLPKPPELLKIGLTQIKMLYTPTLWGKTRNQLKGSTTMPDKDKLTKLVKGVARKGTKYLCVDIEHWPLDGDPEIVQKNMDRFIKIVSWIKEATPKMKVGFYGVPPIRSFWNSTKPITSGRYQKWVNKNKNLKVLAENVDVFFPSLYTFNDDKKTWVKEAKAQISIAKELNKDKPVYIFLWPQYHPYYEEFHNGFLDTDFWTLQLNTARKYADGIVIWTPRKLRWSNVAPWWIATKKFMTDLNKKE